MRALRFFLVTLSLISTSFVSTTAFAMEGDLVLPEAYFGALYNRFICDSFEETGVAAPSAFAAREVQIEKMLADRMLIEFLVAANFKQDDSNCRYSMKLTQARRDALVKTESKAFPLDGTSDCVQGKTELDSLFSGRLPYTFTKNPIRFVALKITTPTAAEVCGEGATHVRMVFEKVQNKQ